MKKWLPLKSFYHQGFKYIKMQLEEGWRTCPKTKLDFIRFDGMLVKRPFDHQLMMLFWRGSRKEGWKALGALWTLFVKGYKREEYDYETGILQRRDGAPKEDITRDRAKSQRPSWEDYGHHRSPVGRNWYDQSAGGFTKNLVRIREEGKGRRIKNESSTVCGVQLAGAAPEIFGDFCEKWCFFVPF